VASVRRGGPESIRQNSIFKDFYLLAENESSKRKFLYVLGTQFPLKFFNGGRALESVLSRNVALKQQFHDKFGTQHRTVRDYYQSRKHFVSISDVSSWVPQLMTEQLDSVEVAETD
jgi:hypothetical protein